MHEKEIMQGSLLLLVKEEENFSLCEFGHSCVLVVRYLCSVPNLVQISVIVTEIDALLLQTFI